MAVCFLFSSSLVIHQLLVGRQEITADISTFKLGEWGEFIASRTAVMGHFSVGAASLRCQFFFFFYITISPCPASTETVVTQSTSHRTGKLKEAGRSQLVAALPNQSSTRKQLMPSVLSKWVSAQQQMETNQQHYAEVF